MKPLFSPHAQSAPLSNASNAENLQPSPAEKKAQPDHAPDDQVSRASVSLNTLRNAFSNFIYRTLATGAQTVNRPLDLDKLDRKLEPFKPDFSKLKETFFGGPIGSDLIVDAKKDQNSAAPAPQTKRSRKMQPLNSFHQRNQSTVDRFNKLQGFHERIEKHFTYLEKNGADLSAAKDDWKEIGREIRSLGKSLREELKQPLSSEEKEEKREAIRNIANSSRNILLEQVRTVFDLYRNTNFESKLAALMQAVLDSELGEEIAGNSMMRSKDATLPALVQMNMLLCTMYRDLLCDRADKQVAKVKDFKRLYKEEQKQIREIRSQVDILRSDTMFVDWKGAEQKIDEAMSLLDGLEKIVIKMEKGHL